MAKPTKQTIVQTSGAVLLGLAASVSLATGVRHAFQYGSHDLQWSGGKLLAQHIDPWRELLEHYPHHVPLLSPPNYLHLLYLLFLPFASLKFGTAELLWCVASIAFSIGSVALLVRLFALSRYQGLIVLFLLWMSSPFRVVLEVGQMSLFEVFFLCLTYAAGSAVIAGAAFGVSLVKYSFSPVAAVLFLLRRHYTVLLVAIGVCCLGIIGCRLFVSTPILQLAREPFQVSRLKVSPGLADIMTVAEYSLRSGLGLDRAKAVSYALALIASVGYAILLSRFRLSKAVELTLVGLASLLFFKHLVYDYVLLVVPLCYAFSLKSLRAKVPILLGVLIFWFLAAFLNRAATDQVVHLPALLLNFVLLAALLSYTTVVAARDELASSSVSDAAAFSQTLPAQAPRTR